jgi:hypothetical protein
MAVNTIDTGIYSGQSNAPTGGNMPGLQALIQALANKGFGSPTGSAIGIGEAGWNNKSAGFGPNRSLFMGLNKAAQGGGGSWMDWLMARAGKGNLGGLFGNTLMQAQSAAATQKLGLQRGGASGTVTSNITD